MHGRTALSILAALALAPVAAPPVAGQEAFDAGRAAILQQRQPALHDLVLRLEAAHGVLLDELAREGEAVRARGDTAATPGFESRLVERLTTLVSSGGKATAGGTATDANFSVLGARGAEVVRRGQAFQRETLSILADPDVVDRSAALADAVTRYRSRPEVALPAVPKDMEILYGHPYALAFRTGYGELDGFIWAGHWLRLAVTEPLIDSPPGPERAAGVDTVTTRYHGKLSQGEAPQAFPSEIPLAPAIAPGLIWLSPESAMIWDNLSMLLEVVADVLASPEASDTRSAVEAALAFFLDPDVAVTDQDEWEIMALRHGIFFQGGFPLAVMTENERNVGGHAAHLAGGAPLMTIPGMPRR
ncbi:MAG: hypothetical protein OEN56_09580 [Gemmatimonadota bacterium]|nr:hypothetical protein [Gemmatimonadota bacterium]